MVKVVPTYKKNNYEHLPKMNLKLNTTSLSKNIYGRRFTKMQNRQTISPMVLFSKGLNNENNVERKKNLGVTLKEVLHTSQRQKPM